MLKVLLYAITVVLSIWALESINLNGIVKKGRYYQIRLLYLFLSFSLSYLVVNFFYDFFLNSKFL